MRDKYKPEYCGIVRNLTARGTTLSEIADILGIADATLWQWQCKHEDFRSSLRLGVEVANERVELALYNLAVGFYYDDEEIKVVGGEIERVKVRRYQAPNPSSAIYWTKAKMGWTDHNSEGADTTSAPAVQDMSPREIARRVAFILHQGEMEQT